MYDVAIVGDGPAGLSAALWLARYRRRVRVYAADEPRNRSAWAVHGYPGFPEITPLRLRRRIREQALGAGAELIHSPVTGIRGEKDAYRVAADTAADAMYRRVLLAFGRRDRIPDIPGAEEIYGISLFHCPDCDGPSMAGSPTGVIGTGRRAAGLALYLRTWTTDLVLLTHGRAPDVDADTRARLDEFGIPIRTATIERTHARNGQLSRISFADGTDIRLSGLFCHTGSEPACDLASNLGCAADDDHYLQTDTAQQTTIPGVFAAGDIAGHPHLTISAAATGVRAALGIHRSLLPDAYRLSSP